MDVLTLRQVATVVVTVAFVIMCVWVFSPRLKRRFDEDAKIPFNDDDIEPNKTNSDITQRNVSNR